MALDAGTRAIGVALSDPLRITSRPLATLRRSGDPEDDAKRVAELATRHDVGRIIFGRPQHLDGRDSETFNKIEPLAQAIADCSGLPLVWAEERLSSKEAERLMAEVGVPHAQRRTRRDEFAAALILQWYIEESCHGV